MNAPLVGTLAPGRRRAAAERIRALIVHRCFSVD